MALISDATSQPHGTAQPPSWWRTGVHVETHACTHAYTHVHTNVHTRVFAHVCIHGYTSVYTHGYAHVYTHGYAHVYTCPQHTAVCIEMSGVDGVEPLSMACNHHA